MQSNFRYEPLGQDVEFVNKQEFFRRKVFSYDDFVKAEDKHIVLHPKNEYDLLMEKIKWCKKNLGKEYYRWAYLKRHFAFTTEEDAVFFKLRWSQ